MPNNERARAIEVISWIKELIRDWHTIFQDARWEESVKLDSGKTRFPDVLIFSDKIAGIVFNGWELKLPDTQADDQEMLVNALEKAEKLKSNSFVTRNWNKAIIWKVMDGMYDLSNIEKLKEYPSDLLVNSRECFTNSERYSQIESTLKDRTREIIHDLEQFYRNWEIRLAVNISSSIVESISQTWERVIPHLEDLIRETKSSNYDFRRAFNEWTILESSTLSILQNSSRRIGQISSENVLARFYYYKLIGKILFYLTLSENIPTKLNSIEIINQAQLQDELNQYFEQAKLIDYQAVFNSDFTDAIVFNEDISLYISTLLQVLSQFDFSILPSEVVWTILESLVPEHERQKFWQYFTSNLLATLVAYPTIKNNRSIIYDPTCGTGSFLTAGYDILKYGFWVSDHKILLNQIWWNDISHFPATLSVINLYKQNVNEYINFPRISRLNYFIINPWSRLKFPDPIDYTNLIDTPVPLFDWIVSNFPFIQQEDINKEDLEEMLRIDLENQPAFTQNWNFNINDRSDYYTYCLYNSLKFLKEDWSISVITSNARLGKDYWLQLKRFMLDNFHVKYIVKSVAEKWFNSAKVNTIYCVLDRWWDRLKPTKFVTLNFKLDEYFYDQPKEVVISRVEEIYNQIDHCDYDQNTQRNQDPVFKELFHKKDWSMDVSIIERERLLGSLETKDNRSTYFISSKIFDQFNDKLVSAYPTIISVGRWLRTWRNDMFYISSRDLESTWIEPAFLFPLIKSPTELKKIEFWHSYRYYCFVCDKNLEELRENYPGAFNRINRFVNVRNSNGTKSVPQACAQNTPFRYSVYPEKNNIVTAINAYKRLFVTYSETPFLADQRFSVVSVNQWFDTTLIAALMNSVISLLFMENMWISRNLWALDLNSNFFKKLKILDPRLLSDTNKIDILAAFQPLKARELNNEILDEMRSIDRINFDTVVLRAFNINVPLEYFYDLLINLVTVRTGAD